MRVTSVDHVSIAVPDIEQALGFFRDVLGLAVTTTDVEQKQGVVVAFLDVGGAEIELIEPVDADSGVARFLRKRGPGMHHICLEVDDLDAAMDRMRSAGVRLIDEQPYEGTGGRRIAFVHPKSAHGVLVELYETLPGDRAGRRLEDLTDLRRRVLQHGHVAVAGTRGFLIGLRRGRGKHDVAARGPEAAPGPE